MLFLNNIINSNTYIAITLIFLYIIIRLLAFINVSILLHIYMSIDITDVAVIKTIKNSSKLHIIFTAFIKIILIYLQFAGKFYQIPERIYNFYCMFSYHPSYQLQAFHLNLSD